MTERIKSQDKLDLEGYRIKKTFQTRILTTKIIANFKVTRSSNKAEVGES